MVHPVHGGDCDGAATNAAPVVASFLADYRPKIAYVFETHRQEDFEFGSRSLAEITGAKIVAGTHELFGECDVRLADKQQLVVGTTRFVALATPGHTPESMSYAVYPKDTGEKCWGVFTGDAG